MLSRAIQTAVKMETDAIQYYQEAAAKPVQPYGKRMFEGFVKDERRHLRILQDILSGLDLHAALSSPPEDISTVFTRLKREMDERVSASTGEVEAVKIALDFESAGYEFYKKAAAEATDETEKALFSRLAEEEQRHHQILSETYSYMADAGEWFLWEEKGLLEG